MSVYNFIKQYSDKGRILLYKKIIFLMYTSYTVKHGYIYNVYAVNIGDKTRVIY